MSTDSPLGRATDYPDRYAPELLHPIPRSEARAAVGIGEPLPFGGEDIWNAWELTWLDDRGKPVVAAAEIRVPATSPNIVESKSLKLYLNSLSMSAFDTPESVRATLEQDLGASIGADIAVHLADAAADTGSGRLPGDCIDAVSVDCEAYEVDADLLQADPAVRVEEQLHSQLLRSLCPVTNQPDLGSVLVAYAGPRIDREGLLRYIVSYRRHHDFHEACVERMYVDILARCQPERLSVYARFQRRGGIDINPFRSSFESHPANVRLWRQ